MRKILLLDIETAPHRVYAWGLWKQDIYIDAIEEQGYILCWAAKWLGEPDHTFRSVHADGTKKMLRDIYKLLDEADIVIHYNGSKFDIPTLNQEFVSQKWAPPSPYKEIDLLKTARQRFRLPSNKLDYVCRYLGMPGKHKHKGMALWTGCMAGDAKSWEIMEAYNRQDVTILEDVYNHLRPWIVNHPNVSLYDDAPEAKCPTCGGNHLQRRGLSHTKTLSYQRYQCQDCGTWSRGKVSVGEPEKKRATLVGVK